MFGIKWQLKKHNSTPSEPLQHSTEKSQKQRKSIIWHFTCVYQFRILKKAKMYVPVQVSILFLWQSNEIFVLVASFLQLFLYRLKVLLSLFPSWMCTDNFWRYQRGSCTYLCKSVIWEPCPLPPNLVVPCCLIISFFVFCFVVHCFFFYNFLLPMSLYVLLPFTAFDYSFVICKLSFSNMICTLCNISHTVVFHFQNKVNCSEILQNYLAFPYFGFERIWWRLFQKRIVRTKLDIYVFFSVLL